MVVRVTLISLLAAAAWGEEYVSYHAQSFINAPPARALSVAVLQHTVAETTALGRYVNARDSTPQPSSP